MRAYGRMLLAWIRPFRAGLWISVGFLAVDGVWLSLLPVWQISYGSVLVALLAFGAIRACILAFWFLLFGLCPMVKHRPLGRAAHWVLAVLNLAALALALYGFVVEPTQLTVTRIEVAVPGLTRPVRVVQLSDIHVERTSQRELALPDLVAGLHPDVIALTGDYVSKLYPGDTQMRNDLRALVGQLHAPMGVYAVNGNVESPYEEHRLLDGLGVQILDNKIVRLPGLGDHLVILGVNFNKYSPDQRALARLMKQLQPDDFSLLLYHKPDMAYTARNLGVDLYLTGHTHGGQVRLPFYGALVTNSSLGKQFEMGRYQLDPMTMFVTRGIGMGGRFSPRVRFLCPPEVVVIDLVPAPSP